jgi:DNA-binding NarL/FixJ family response regulator
MPIRLAIAAYDRSVLDRLAQICSLERDFKIVARATTGKEAVRAVPQFWPDILVLDMRIRDPDALAVLRRIQKGSVRIRTVILDEADSDAAHEAIRLGVRGVMLMEKAPRLLAKSIREVDAGGKWFERDYAIGVLDRLLTRQAGEAAVGQVLTRRQLEVARLSTTGLRNVDIAKKLSITEGTAKLHLHHVYEKLKLNGRASLKEYLQSIGLG